MPRGLVHHAELKHGQFGTAVQHFPGCRTSQRVVVVLMSDLLLASMHPASASFNESCCAETSLKFSFAAKAKEMLSGGKA